MSSLRGVSSSPVLRTASQFFVLIRCHQSDTLLQHQNQWRLKPLCRDYLILFVGLRPNTQFDSRRRQTIPSKHTHTRARARAHAGARQARRLPGGDRLLPEEHSGQPRRPGVRGMGAVGGEAGGASPERPVDYEGEGGREGRRTEGVKGGMDAGFS